MRTCWNDVEIDLALRLYEDGLNSTKIAEKLNRTPKAVSAFFNKRQIYFTDKFDKSSKRTETCLRCSENFEKHKSETRKVCIECCDILNQIDVTNKLEAKKKRASQNKKLLSDLSIHKGKKCLFCEKIIDHNNHFRVQKFCNIQCGIAFKARLLELKAISGQCSHATAKNYLVRKHGAVCMECGWSKVNPHTNTIPVELEHIDGNSENNNLSNLKLLCPNCHSLTPTYKGANAGNGRARRRERYAAGKSY